MTTIAFRDGIMAADSCLSENDKEENTRYIGQVQKIYQLADRSLLGMSGDAEAQCVINLLNDKSIADEKMADKLASLVGVTCKCLMVRPNGRMFFVTTGEDESEFTPFIDRFAAVGTGNEFAYGAMEHGATALQAVEAASRRNAYTREPFVEVHLNSRKRLTWPPK